MSNEVKIKEGLVLRPGDKALLVLDGNPTFQEVDTYTKFLRERFPEVEFSFMSGVSALTVLRNGEADAALAK